MSDSFYDWFFLADTGDRYGGTLVADTGTYFVGWTLDTGLGVYGISGETAFPFDLSASGFEEGEVFTSFYIEPGLGLLTTLSGGRVPTGTQGLGTEYDFAFTGFGPFGGFDDFGVGGIYQVDGFSAPPGLFFGAPPVVAAPVLVGAPAVVTVPAGITAPAALVAAPLVPTLFAVADLGVLAPPPFGASAEADGFSITPLTGFFRELDFGADVAHPFEPFDTTGARLGLGGDGVFFGFV